MRKDAEDVHLVIEIQKNPMPDSREWHMAHINTRE